MQALRRSQLTRPCRTGVPNWLRSVLIFRRPLSTSAPIASATKHASEPRCSRRILQLTTAILGSLVIGIWADAKSCPEPPFRVSANSATSSQDVTDTTTAMIPAPDFLPLVRTYFVYASISAPFLVDHAPVLLDKLLNVPVVGSIIEAIVRRTFFAQYVGGETVQDALPVIHRLRSEDMGAMMVYSVEVDEKEAAGSEESRRASPHPVRDAPGARPFHKRTVEEIIRGIDAAADFEDHLAAKSVDQGRSTCFAVKLSALLPRAESLRNLSLHLVRTRPIPLEPIPFPGTPSSTDLAVLNRSSRYHGVFPLSEEDIKDLKELYDDLKRICMRAKERRIRVMIDAEHSWYQPAIDAYGHALMQQFNKLPQKEGLVTRWFLASSPKGEEPRPVQPLVYMTYQAYLRRTPAHLAHSLALARRKGYALGVKLVRGAYHPYEIAMHNDQSSHTMSISPDVDPPVYLSKADTDACYNTCASVLVRAIAEDVLSSPPASTQAARLGVLFGTHNWLSSELVLQELVKSGLAREEGGRNGEKGRVVIPPEVADRCSFGQLYGMADSLSNYLVQRTSSTTPCVVKYTPYGALSEVMPYLSRRAVENKSVLGEGGATRERKLAARMIWHKFFSGVGL